MRLSPEDRPLGWTFEAMPHANLRVLSLGAGVQSTVLALMAVRGEFGDKPDHMIFADTQWEPKAVMRHLEWLTGEVARLSNNTIPVHIVTAGNIKQDALNGVNTTGQKFYTMPFHTTTGGMGRRQCTMEYKIRPIYKKIRQLVGLRPRKHWDDSVIVEQWLGISKDEAQRMSMSRNRGVVNRYPLIEKDMSRQDCMSWWNKHYPEKPDLIKSACIACPFKSNEEWRWLRDESPEEWADAVAFDEAVRETEDAGQQFCHRKKVPLKDADLEPKEQGDLFGEDCAGMCGV